MPGLLSLRQFQRPRKGPAHEPRLIRRGGAEETRTPDPLLAKEVLYQLSYGPERGSAAFGAAGATRERSERVCGGYGPSRRSRLRLQRVVQRALVGVSGLEPEASALSGQCSNQLS